MPRTPLEFTVDPNLYMPIVSNHFVFGNLRIERFIDVP